MATLELRQVKKRFGEVEVIRGVDLDVADREFVVFVGPSGCGKSTLLRMIAGLEEISEGTLTIDGELENDTPPAKRGLAMVFQSYALYPHMTVGENMSFSLRLAGKSKAERREAAARAAKILQLEPLLERKPRALSGGQRQRVAIGRAIVRDPKVFLFDEPLSNLDAALRVQMRTELARLHDELSATMIYVTHDQVEAMTLADKIVVLRDGLVEQAGPPLELYHHPANLFVASFIGSPTMNILDAAVASAGPDGVEASLKDGGKVTAPVSGEGVGGGSPVKLGVRPEHLALADEGPLAGEVTITERLGGVTYVHVREASGQTLIVEADGASRVKLHDRVRMRLDPEHVHLFDPDGVALPQLARNPLADLPAH